VHGHRTWINQSGRAYALLLKLQRLSGHDKEKYDWRRFCIVKSQKTKNRSNLPINRTELAEI
jgi:hypothetical protein